MLTPKIIIILNILKLRRLFKHINNVIFYNLLVKPGLILKNKKITFKSDKDNVLNKTVLIVEPNPYHGEIITGYIKYFLDLGYNVDLLLRYEVINENPFCLCDLKFNLLIGNENYIKNYIVKSITNNNYDFIFISSSFYFDGDFYFGPYFKYINIEPPKNLLCIHHSVSHIEKCGFSLSSPNIFTLSGFQNTKMLNPLYFGNIISKPKNKVTKFFVAGRINKNVKNFDLLGDAVKKLHKNGINNFKIYVIGEGKKTVKDKNIVYLGRTSFKKMYQTLMNSDYILALLDPFMHEPYLNETTSGTKQLSLGFLKPCIINEKFAKAYWFDKSNSVIYSENNLYEAMEKSIHTTDEEYSEMRCALNDLANLVYTTSLQNLKETIG